MLSITSNLRVFWEALFRSDFLETHQKLDGGFNPVANFAGYFKCVFTDKNRKDGMKPPAESLSNRFQ